FVWDGSRLLQEYTYKGSYTYLYTDQDSYEPLAQIFDNAKDETQYLAYFHNDQIGIPREMTDIHGNLLWYGEYTAWGRLKKDGRVYQHAHQPFRLQNQYFDEETGLHYNLMRYYEPEAGRFVNQDPIGLLGGDNLYQFAPNAQIWIDYWGLARLTYRHTIKPDKKTNISELRRQIRGQIKAMNKIIQEEGLIGLKARIRAYNEDVEKEGRNFVKTLGPAGDCKAWLHEPDMRTGGKPMDVTKVGDKRINSILGGQADRIARDILEMPDETTKITYQLKLKR
ncbi:RHS repeat-associated core domain-containing protein, partial [Neisseria polysaccharea]|uniref:RHS repeat-associated core domain-containing protein n=3 Tax=Neisseria TaxID=482 RepID=UPI00272D6E11